MKKLPAVLLLLTSLHAGYAETPAGDKKPSATPEKVKLRFTAWDGDPKKPAEMTFQINSVGPSNFLKLGDLVPKTNYKLTSFDADLAADSFKLTLTDTVTKETLVLTLPKPIDSKPAKPR